MVKKVRCDCSFDVVVDCGEELRLEREQIDDVPVVMVATRVDEVCGMFEERISAFDPLQPAVACSAWWARFWMPWWSSWVAVRVLESSWEWEELELPELMYHMASSGTRLLSGISGGMTGVEGGAVS